MPMVLRDLEDAGPPRYAVQRLDDRAVLEARLLRAAGRAAPEAAMSEAPADDIEITP